MRKKKIVISRIDKIIAGYFAQELDNSELAELHDWMKSASENKEYFVQKQEGWFSPVGGNNEFHFI
jgi:hypothetical protein